MEKVLGVLIMATLIYGTYNALYHDKKITTQDKAKECTICQKETVQLSHLKKELQELQTPHYIKEYIIDIIDHGSYDLGFKGGVMEGGFASHEDAEKIACYLLTLSGKKCPTSYKEDAEMFFTSNCGGCHGNDAKGLPGGNYPDLTRPKLLDIEKKEEHLKAEIAKLQRQNAHH
jgi:cytochrome c553